jgi:hypothetical protein
MNIDVPYHVMNFPIAVLVPGGAGGFCIGVSTRSSEPSSKPPLGRVLRA